MASGEPNRRPTNEEQILSSLDQDDRPVGTQRVGDHDDWIRAQRLGLDVIRHEIRRNAGQCVVGTGLTIPVLLRDHPGPTEFWLLALAAVYVAVQLLELNNHLAEFNLATEKLWNLRKNAEVARARSAEVTHPSLIEEAESSETPAPSRLQTFLPLVGGHMQFPDEAVPGDLK